jgi:peptidoglycan-associated lipoprotein
MMRRFGYFAATIVIVGMTTAACGGKKPETPAPAPPPPAPAPSTAPSSPPPPPPPPATPPPAAPTEDEIFAKMTNEEVAKKYLTDVFFAYDSIEIAEPQRASLQKNAAFMKQRQSVRILIEGHADSRGTNEYNLALGERRADAVRDYMVSLGVAAERITIVSKGEEQPFCREETETCWQENRRGHFIVTGK